MAADVARNDSAAGGMPDENYVLQVERFDERCQVFGERVHAVCAAPGLGRAAEATPVIGDAAVSAVAEEEPLIVPGIGAERPTVAEDHRLLAGTVFVVDVDVGGIFFTDSDVWHWGKSFLS